METLRFHDEVREPPDLGLREGGKASPAAVRRMTRAIREASAEKLDRVRRRVSPSFTVVLAYGRLVAAVGGLHAVPGSRRRPSRSDAGSGGGSSSRTDW